MQLVRFDPVRELEQVEREMDSLWNGGWSLLPSFAEPTLDMYKEKEKLIAEVRLPSFKKDEVKVKVVEGGLEVTAEHKVKKEETADRQYYSRESLSTYMRRISLPEGAKADKAAAEFKEGILKISMPFTTQKETKKLEIK